MHFDKLSKAAVLAAAALFWLATPAVAPAANLVQNGDFTNTLLSSPGGFFCQSGATCTSNVADWDSVCAPGGPCGDTGTVNSLLFPGTGGAAFNHGFGLSAWVDPPVAGNIDADDGDSTFEAAISQTVNGLTAGKNYVLTFWQAGAQQGGQDSATSRDWQVSLGSQTRSSAVMNLNGDDFAPWTQQTMHFTATSGSEVLTFMASGTGTPPIALLTGVSLTAGAVPEPGVWAMVILGFGALGVVARRRRQRAIA